VIARTRHGFVLAAAGVDASNTAPGTLVLLPADPDASARRLRAGLLAALGLSRLGIVVTDTMGRAWREGVVDVAVGCAGLTPLVDLRGTTDAYGNELDVTVVALADEAAAASELVRPKLGRVPVAVLRGLGAHVGAGDGPGGAALVRPASTDRFPLGAREAVRAAVRAYGSERPAVAATADGLEQAVAAVAAALPDVGLVVTDADVEVLADDAARGLEAEVLLRVALAGEGVTGVRVRRSAPPTGY
jgi:coenzyme F420-0:L-glutamate ligase/coenzyme F420-1:gamma-L-glutamate ligase